MSDEDRKAKGLELAQRLFRGAPPAASLPPDQFREYSFTHLFGDVWQQPDLSLEERSLVTCTVLVALDRQSEQRLHFLGAKNLGIERAKIEGMITHVAHYAGWPCAAAAHRVLNEVWPREEP